MSTVIIIGNGGRRAIDLIVDTSTRMTPEQQIAAVALIEKFERDAQVLCSKVRIGAI